MRHVGDNLLSGKKSQVVDRYIARRSSVSEKSRLDTKDVTDKVDSNIMHVTMLKPISSDRIISTNLNENWSTFLIVNVVCVIFLQIKHSSIDM